MTKFELKKGNVEISYKNRNELKTGCACESLEPELIKTFDSKEAALEGLKKYETDIQELSGPLGTYFSVTEYYVEESRYDDEDEFVETLGIWKFSVMNIRVQNKNDSSEGCIYHSYVDAELACDALDENYYISFL